MKDRDENNTAWNQSAAVLSKERPTQDEGEQNPKVVWKGLDYTLKLPRQSTYKMHEAMVSAKTRSAMQ